MSSLLTHSTPVTLAVILSIGAVLFLLFGSAAIGGSYLLTLHAIHDQHVQFCANLHNLSNLFIKVNANTKHAVPEKQSSSFQAALAISDYYKASCVAS